MEKERKQEQEVYEVIIVNDNAVVTKDHVCAENCDKAKMAVIAAHHGVITPDSRVYCRPFCRPSR